MNNSSNTPLPGKLIKLKSTHWQGNGFGTSTAVWGITGFDGYTIRGATGLWSVFDAASKRVISAHSRNQALETFLQVMGDKQCTHI